MADDAFTFEKLKIDQRMREMETVSATRNAEMSARCTSIDAKLDHMNELSQARLDLIEKEIHTQKKEMYGEPGINGRPGVKTVVTRLNDSDKRRTWNLRTLWGFCLAFMGRIFYEIFKD